MKNEEIYNKSYYDTHTGINYHDEKQWEDLFRRFAKHIVDDFNPKTVLDVGCAFGYVVKYLRELGVDAYGIDISSYAIDQAGESVRPYLHVLSADDELPSGMPQSFDMVLNIEMIEHVSEEKGINILKKICSYTDQIFFSSTSTDYIEPTHINVQKPEYWSSRFASLGFYKLIEYNADFLSKDAFVFRKMNLDVIQLIQNYEKAIYSLKMCFNKEQLTSVKLLNDNKILRNELQTNQQYYNQSLANVIKKKDEIEINFADKEKQLLRQLREFEIRIRKTSELNESLINVNNDLKECIDNVNGRIKQEELNKYNLITLNKCLHTQIDAITLTRGYKLLKNMYKIEERIIPYGSKRRNWLKYIVRKPFVIAKHLQGKINKKNVIIPTDNSSFYTPEEKARLEWCINNPIKEDILFSVVVPLYNTPINLLKDLVESIENQIYTNWELCLVNASDKKDEIRDFVLSKQKKNSKIIYKELDKNEGISKNTKQGICLANGEYLALLDHDDLISPNALYENAQWLLEHKETDFLYSDKDMIDATGTKRMNTLYKPEYSPELMLSANYFTHFCVFRKGLLSPDLDFDELTDGAQDWDIFLKIMSKSKNVKRISEILYHWRIVPTSVASGAQAKPYVYDAQIRALNNYLLYNKLPGEIFFSDKLKSFLKVKWAFRKEYSVCILVANGYEINGIQSDNKTEIHYINNMRDYKEAINETKADVLVFVDAVECKSLDLLIIEELCQWSFHPEIAFVSPALISNGAIKSCGLVYKDNQLFDMFFDKKIGYYGEMGSSEWYRNFSLFRKTCVVIEKEKILKLTANSLINDSFNLYELFFLALKEGLRNVYNPFAKLEVFKLENINKVNCEINQLMKEIKINQIDPYFNVKCSHDIQASFHEHKIIEDVVLSQYSSDALVLSNSFDFTLNDLVKNTKCLNNNSVNPIKTIVWFLQEFDYVFFAGLYTIFRTADYLRREKGIINTFAFLTSLDSNVMMDRIAEGFPQLAQSESISLKSFDDLSLLSNFDASICTLWTTAYYSLKFNNVRKKFYFIQDYEPLFYPGGSTYAQTDATYRFGFYGICNTTGLRDVYTNEYNSKAVSLNPSIDTRIFYPSTTRQYEKKVYTLFFYGRPGHPRNGFELGVIALKTLKKKMGKHIRIVTAGADYDTSLYGLQGIVENLGRLKIEETGELYRQCDVGLVMMFTRHPSYLPYEMMACGCAVVSNYNPYTTWFLRNDKNCIVCEPSASSIAESIENILKDSNKRERISKFAAEQVTKNNPSWEESLDSVAMFIQEVNFDDSHLGEF